MQILYPVNILTCKLMDTNNNNIINVFGPLDITTDWGIPFYITNGFVNETIKLDSIWYSEIDTKFYYANATLNFPDKIKELLIGYFPNGFIVIWGIIKNKTYLLYQYSANEITEYISKLINQKTNLNFPQISKTISFIHYFCQYLYRYTPCFELYNKNSNTWLNNVPLEFNYSFDYIEESLYDGTHDKLHDDSLLKYHEAGKPKKIAIKWHIKKSEYIAYFWFEDEKICEIFECFYGDHPDTKADFIIRIDAENKKYELALFRQGLKDPQIIPENAYQLLVFKNKFEDYRSDNYNQERGAWIW